MGMAHNTYKLRVIWECNMSPDSIINDFDSDIIYNVDFFIDNYDSCTNIEHVLDPVNYQFNLELAGVKDVDEFESELRHWLMTLTAENKLIVCDNLVVDVSFGLKKEKVVFKLLTIRK